MLSAKGIAEDIRKEVVTVHQSGGSYNGNTIKGRHSTWLQLCLGGDPTKLSRSTRTINPTGPQESNRPLWQRQTCVRQTLDRQTLIWGLPEAQAGWCWHPSCLPTDTHTVCHIQGCGAAHIVLSPVNNFFCVWSPPHFQWPGLTPPPGIISAGATGLCAQKEQLFQLCQKALWKSSLWTQTADCLMQHVNDWKQSAKWPKCGLREKRFII